MEIFEIIAVIYQILGRLGDVREPESEFGSESQQQDTVLGGSAREEPGRNRAEIEELLCTQNQL